MLSEVYKTLLLAVCCFSAVDGFRNVCSGSDLSVRSNLDVKQLSELLKEDPCTHVAGDVVIENLTDIAIPIEVYKRVRHVHGSIIIANNTNISSPIHFPSLRSINASLLPCILVLFNENVKFSVGGQFSKALTQHPIKFAVLKNKNRVIDMNDYNLWYLAGHPARTFLIDSSLSAEICLEDVFKPLAGIMGFLFVALASALSTILFYDRSN
ncbi:Receptor L-domain domain-containing protein [Caenorhabditis elegans]|uniref:Receptor L-domain domain-containing protein n=3 Tax=Caenorhabditis elegans TaxID=6239 RepID=A0A168H459_CAEEL|nr:Receptor L-domain domain-containing protein [Caenorhabditis elegans]SAP35559.1 Receptor L-domain domain-containing protein [Caenorhabditis elegans]|eukprot:NP_001317801.1 Insulin/EGF-Receptor L Domain protein [Caenorhabditis elegans]